ncbi:hypothetical protein JA1_000082 [Spathaspora sp. JA1]|nr:hypothetical protein JA1_000082 [Spathaspora sp. JA1]
MLTILPQLNEWKIVTIVQLAIFLVCFIAFIIIAVHQFNKHNGIQRIRMFLIGLTLFHLFKIMGAILGLVFIHQDTFNTNIFIPTYIFDTISMAMLTNAIKSLVEVMLLHQQKQNMPPPSYDPKYLENGHYEQQPTRPKKEKLNFPPFKILSLILLAAVILNIIGISQLSSGETTTTVKTLTKVSSVLFLAGVLLLIVLMVYIHGSGQDFEMVTKVLIGALIILIVRCSYTMASAFSGLSFVHPNQFMIYFGHWQYYCFMGMVMEAIAGCIVLWAFSVW